MFVTMCRFGIGTMCRLSARTVVCLTMRDDLLYSTAKVQRRIWHCFFSLLVLDGGDFIGGATTAREREYTCIF